MDLIPLAALLLLLFGLLGLADGFYYHIWKFRLYLHKESRFEHLIHTIRAVAFVPILYFFFIKDFSGWYLWIGLGFIIVDLIALSIDVFSEAGSRKHLGGMPSIEYFIHILANGFHFSSLILIIASKPLAAWSFNSGNNFENYSCWFEQGIAQNLMPGAALLAITHILLLFSVFNKPWISFQNKTESIFRSKIQMVNK